MSKSRESQVARRSEWASMEAATNVPSSALSRRVPVLTIIVPVYNEVETLGELLRERPGGPL